MFRPYGSVMAPDSDAGGLSAGPFIQYALSLRQPTGRDGATFRSHNLGMMQSAHNPPLCRALHGALQAISGSALPARGPRSDWGTAIRRERAPRRFPPAVSVFSASGSSSARPWAADPPAAVPRPPDWDRSSSRRAW